MAAIRITTAVQVTTIFDTVVDGVVVNVNRTGRKVTSYDVLVIVEGVSTILVVEPKNIKLA